MKASVLLEQLSESIAYMKRLSSEEDESALEKLKEEMKMMAPGAAKKYVTSGKLTKKEICVLLFVAFGELLKETSYKKGKLEELLANYIAKETVDPIKKLYVSDDKMIGEDHVVPGTNEQNDNDQSAKV